MAILPMLIDYLLLTGTSNVMETFFVDSPEIAQNSIALAELEDSIRNTAQQYERAVKRAKSLLAGVDKETAATIIAGTPRYVYMKQLGHKALTPEDVSAIINALGTEEEKQVITAFPQAQKALNDRLKTTPIIGTVYKQAKLTSNQYYQRQDVSERWTPEQMIAVIDVLDRLRV
ncbi:hypothetical protein ACFQ4C_06875 [Larkinella insperata]|uniref:Uncharacterized protein n=1 Tax=Larkinella insperata TaxID=332158 RepID=A0ABW3Q5V6_9BACT